MPPPKISMFLPSLGGGGAERVFVQLANEFARMGCAVDLVLVAARGPYMREVSPKIRIVDLGCSKVALSLPSLIRYLRSERPDALLSALDNCNIVAVLGKILSRTGICTVISQRAVMAPLGFYLESIPALVNRLLTLAAIRLTYPWSDHLVAVSTDVAEELKRYPFIRERKVSTIFNPIDIPGIEARLSLKGEESICQIPPAPYVLGVGRLAKQKDFATLIRAFAKVAPETTVSLAILGEGKERPALIRLADELGVRHRVLLPGFVENPFPWFAAASVFVLSSIFEGCPNALMQALACGTPVLSTDCPGGSAEILERGKWGRLVPVGDSAAMAQAILSTLGSTTPPDVRRRAKDFALDVTARQYLRILLPGYSPPLETLTPT